MDISLKEVVSISVPALHLPLILCSLITLIYIYLPAPREFSRGFSTTIARGEEDVRPVRPRESNRNTPQEKCIFKLKMFKRFLSTPKHSKNPPGIWGENPPHRQNTVYPQNSTKIRGFFGVLTNSLEFSEHFKV